LRRRLACAAFALAASLQGAHAQDPEKLTSGPGAALTAQKCQICHELAHVTRSRLSRGEWVDNLQRMRERGAPLSDAEVETIVAYLATYYGRDPGAPRATTSRRSSSVRRFAKSRRNIPATRALRRASRKKCAQAEAASGERCRCRRTPDSQPTIRSASPNGC